MINVFNYPIEPSAIDEFHEERDDGEERVFEPRRRRPEVTYLGERKVVDGEVVEGTQSANAMWSTTITRGVAHEWKERAEGRGGRLRHAQVYLNALRQDLVRGLSKGNRYATGFLLLVNTVLLLFFLYIVHVF